MRELIRTILSRLMRVLDGSGSRRVKRMRGPGEETTGTSDELPPADRAADHPTCARPSRRTLARVFDSAHPVRSPAELMGRERELAELLTAALDFGQHIIVHGARGSGKTSLVRIFGDHADQQGAVVIYMACEAGASFADLVMPYLRSLPPVALHSGRCEDFARELASLPEKAGPRAVVELVCEYVAGPVIFIFDEFDRITDRSVKADISAAMKLLSDALSSVLFILVGIARDVSEVLAGHPSLRRHMRTIALGRISHDSVEDMILSGAAACGVAFEEAARAIVARAACGSPFHIRLFAHHAALTAIGHESTTVSKADALAGLRSAFDSWAAMNAADAQTITALVNAARSFDALEDAARRAAIDDRLPPEGAELLTGLVSPEDGDKPTLVFGDSVAPQFMIAAIIFAELLAVAPGGLAAPREFPYAVNL